MSLGEGVCWCEPTQCLYWVDIDRRQLFEMRWVDRRVRHWKLPFRPTAVAAWQPPRLLLAVEQGLASFHTESGAFDMLLSLVDTGSGIRMNDAVTDPRGRFWAGSMDERAGGPSGRIFRVDTDGRCSAVLSGIGIANGLAFTSGGTRLVFADSAQGCLYVSSIDPETGAAGAAQVLARAEIAGGTPDGAAMDEEGCLWSCRWDGWGIVRVSGDGRIDCVIDLPVQRPTKCCFGGPGGNLLFVVSATTGLSPGELAAQPLAGSLCAFEPGVRGAHLPAFGAPAGVKFEVASTGSVQ